MIERTELLAQVTSRLKSNQAVALLGPRQCGKTTLARELAADRRSSYFDLESPRDLARLSQPMTALEPLRGLVVIDEVQRHPELFPILRVLIDRKPAPAKFLVLGSASPELLRQTSETLAGRIAFIDMGGFVLNEIPARDVSKLWVRGGFPRSFLARSERQSFEWREDFIRTFLERDLAQLGSRVAAPTMRRFWTMIAHYSGGTWNGSEIGRSIGEAHTTVRRRLDVLSAALVVRVLEPWFENIGKRQVKAPKVYIRDTGILHALLGITDHNALDGHPKVGASWEGFVIEQTLTQIVGARGFYWRTQAGAELDLFLTIRGERIGIEIKRSDAPKVTPSMQSALKDLKLHRLFVVYPGNTRYALSDRIDVLPLDALVETLSKLR